MSLLSWRHSRRVGFTVVRHITSIGVFWELFCLQKTGRFRDKPEIMSPRLQIILFEQIRFLDKFLSKCGTWAQSSRFWWAVSCLLVPCLSSCSLFCLRFGVNKYALLDELSNLLCSSIISLAFCSSCFWFWSSLVLRSQLWCAISNSAARYEHCLCWPTFFCRTTTGGGGLIWQQELLPSICFFIPSSTSLPSCKSRSLSLACSILGILLSWLHPSSCSLEQLATLRAFCLFERSMLRSKWINWLLWSDNLVIFNYLAWCFQFFLLTNKCKNKIH